MLFDQSESLKMTLFPSLDTHCLNVEDMRKYTRQAEQLYTQCTIHTMYIHWLIWSLSELGWGELAMVGKQRSVCRLPCQHCQTKADTATQCQPFKIFWITTLPYIKVYIWLINSPPYLVTCHGPCIFWSVINEVAYWAWFTCFLKALETLD